MTVAVGPAPIPWAADVSRVVGMIERMLAVRRAEGKPSDNQSG
jgi:hypothetical protein